METSANLASVPGGQPLGTERLPARSLLPRTGAGETGQLFSEEVDRAMQRVRGEGSQAKRLEEGLAERRATRRAGFGGGRDEEEAPRAQRTSARTEHTPVAPAPAAPPALPEDSAPPPAPRPGGPSTCSSCIPGGEPSAATEGAVGSAAPSAPIAVPPVAAPASSAVSSAAVAALESAPRGETQPLELPQAERGAPVRGARGPAVPTAPAQPDFGPLQRAEEILRQIELHASPGVRRLTLDLDPADLGRLSIQLALRTGRVTAIVRAENPETLALLQEHEAELTGLLDRRGLRADSVSFELGFRSARSAPASSPSRPPRTDPRAAGPFLPPEPDAARSPLPRLDTLA